MAQALRLAAARPGDVVARYGSEEFVVLLPGVGPQGAVNVGERLRAAVEALALPHGAAGASVVTLSVGAASLVPSQDATPDRLLKAADEALYQAKERGRNRVAA